jgi:CHAD domain-containing protein
MILGEQSVNSPEQPVQQLRQIFRDQIASALREIKSAKDTRPANVHAARKQLKKARATLRLLRTSLGNQIYRHENETVRDTARPLSVVRDSEILLATLDSLMARYPQELKGEHIERVRRAIKRHRRKLTEAVSMPESITAIRKSLLETQGRASRWSLKSGDWPSILRGMQRTYRAGRADMDASRSDPTTEALHDWRKQAKYLWHQLQVLTPVASGEIGSLADQFHRLSTYLGDEHDLAVLKDKLPEFKVLAGGELSTSLTTAIERRRKSLRSKAFSLGEQLYAHKPDRFARGLSSLWEDWAKADSERQPARSGSRARITRATGRRKRGSARASKRA